MRAYAEVVLGRQRSPRHEQGDHMVAYLRAANVKDGELDLRDVKTMNFAPEEQKVFALAPGDVLITEGSGSRSAVGASAVWNGEIDGVVCFQNTLLRARPREGTDERFLAWWCRHAFGSGLFAEEATGANIFHLSAQRVRSIPMAYLPLAEQRAIADFLDTETARIDALITKKRRLINLLEERWLVRARALLIGPDWAGNPFDVRATYRMGRDVAPFKLARVAEFGSGTTPASANTAYYGGTVPWVVTGDLNDRQITSAARTVTYRALQDYSALKVHPAGTLVVAMYGATIGRVGVLSQPAAVNQACCTIRPGSSLDAGFLFMYLRAFRAELIELGRGSGQPNISQELLRMAYVALPSLGFQRRVGEALLESRGACDVAQAKLNKQIDLLQEKRQALITAAVTGELEIPGVAA